MTERQNWFSRLLPKSFLGQSFSATIATLLAAQILTVLFASEFVLKPQINRVAGIVAQAVDASSQVADLADARGRKAMIERLDQSEFLEVLPGEQPPPIRDGRVPTWLEFAFMQAFVDALDNRSELLWRTDLFGQLWIQVRIGPELYWITAHTPRALHPILSMALSAGTAIGLALAGVFALQKRIARPLQSLTHAVEKIDLGRPLTIFPAEGPDELVALSGGFNRMVERLNAAERERAIMLAGISHDIRTPLAKLRLAVEMLSHDDDELSRSAHAQVQEIDRILSKFLQFARGFESERLQKLNVDVLVAEIAELHQAEGVTFKIDGHVGSINGRPEALRRALLNLTENARRYGEEPYVIKPIRSAENIVIVVSDSGPGVPFDNFDGLVRPFVRGSNVSESGTGLGLAIVEQVAVLHGGGLELANVPGGFEARLRLSLLGPSAAL